MTSYPFGTYASRLFLICTGRDSAVMPRRRAFTSDYLAVLASDRWAQLKTRLLAIRGRRCQHCLTATGPLDLHHVTYTRLGREHDADVLILCRPCHKRADLARKKATRAHRQEARINGWATKVYGPDWWWTHDPRRVAEAFAGWRTHRRERRVR